MILFIVFVPPMQEQVGGASSLYQRPVDQLYSHQDEHQGKTKGTQLKDLETKTRTLHTKNSETQNCTGCLLEHFLSSKNFKETYY